MGLAMLAQPPTSNLHISTSSETTSQNRVPSDPSAISEVISSSLADSGDFWVKAVGHIELSLDYKYIYIYI